MTQERRGQDEERDHGEMRGSKRRMSVAQRPKVRKERYKLTAKVIIQRARNLINLDYNGEMKGNVVDRSDPYGLLAVTDSAHARRVVSKSKVVYNSLDPVWNHGTEEFDLWSDEMLHVEVWDKDAGEEADDCLGVLLAPVEQIMVCGMEGEFPLDLSLVPTPLRHGHQSWVSVKVILGPAQLVEDRRSHKTMYEMIEAGELPSFEEMDKLRNVFEGTGGGEGDRVMRLRKQLGSRTRETEVEHFLGMMRERGEGSITLAWRRYFDSDGDGSLSFCEFCEALTEFEYKKDVLKLWHALSDGAAELGLEVLDAEGAEILDSFARWCEETLGGPYEVFEWMDQDGSDSLEADEFVEGLEELGFFNATYLPEAINTPQAVLNNLYPLLDKRGHGCVTADQVLFLEKDKEKRLKIEKKLARIRNYGHDGAPEPLANDAQRFLNNAYMKMTPAGGKTFKTLRGTDAMLACGEKDGPRPKWKKLMREKKNEHRVLRRAESTPSIPRNYMAEAMESLVNPDMGMSGKMPGKRRAMTGSTSQLPKLPGTRSDGVGMVVLSSPSSGDKRLPAIEDRKLSKG
eukprot:TRINITY_DN101860_c0_g1_i1.p1 TRINITY_DN101860_c0_g1~~TRINITY_DN101860_c0_g1_i1.p1  ORF type:complete len:571 (-),score=135.16 TRINITY_DN101860_c0_g1_i1:75-1787(-)